MNRLLVFGIAFDHIPLNWTTCCFRIRPWGRLDLKEVADEGEAVYGRADRLRVAAG
jgi:hypothetical protein